ncbi:hypothetical protein LINGRAHAP2_LOCUS25079 [Linum grandiflorum]
MLCKHGECAMVNISSTGRNPGRKFYRCRHWKDKASDCDFFKWVDEVSSTEEDKAPYSVVIEDLTSKLSDCEDRLKIAEGKALRRKGEVDILKSQISGNSSFLSEIREIKFHLCAIELLLRCFIIIVFVFALILALFKQLTIVSVMFVLLGVTIVPLNKWRLPYKY